MSRLSFSPLAAILALALVLRLWGIHDRLPDPSLGIDPIQDSVIDETDRREMAIAWEMWRGGIKPFDLNPHTAEWPALSIYGTLLFQFLYRATFSIGARTLAAQPFALHVQAHPDQIFLFARFASAILLGVGTVWLTFLLGSRLLGRSIGLLAALLIATNPFHILVSQHVSDPNLWALLFSLAASLCFIQVRDGGGIGPSLGAGVMIGLAAASKYVPVILAAPYTLGHLSGNSLRDGIARLARNRAFLIGLLAIALAFLLASPFTAIDWKTTKSDLLLQHERHVSDWTGMSRYPFSLPTYLLQTIPQTMGWPFYVLSIAGLALMFRRGGSTAVIASIPVLYVLANGALSVAQPRFILPALGASVVAASLAMTRAGSLLATRLGGRFSEGGVVAAIGAASLIGPAMDLASTRRELALPDARHESRRWITQNIPAGAPIAVSAYGPAFNTTTAERLTVDWPFYAAEPVLVEKAYDPIWLDGFDYYVTSSEVSRRFAVDLHKYHRESSFYGWMITNTLVTWKSDPARYSGPIIEVRRLPPRISTESERDSTWAAWPASSGNTERLAQWCLRSGVLFYLKGDLQRAGEWGRRGLTIQTRSTKRGLFALIVMAESGQNRPERAIEAAHAALKAYPDDAGFHLYLGVALQRAGRPAEAVLEYMESLRLDPGQPGALELAAEIAKLEGGRR